MKLNNKVLLLALIAGITVLPVNSEELSDVTHPKNPSYRVGISELPETQYQEVLQQQVKLEKKYVQLDNSQYSNIADRTYADLSIKNLSREVAQDLEFEEQDMLADLSLLWQGAAMQSDTINFALYKLANPDADKPDEKSIKKVLKTIASMSTLVGASMGSPILAGSSLIGGNILGIMSQDTKALNYKYTRVNDADMIILIRKVEDLQQNAVNLYYDYMSAKKQLDFATKLVEERQEKFNLAQKNNASRELVVITDAYYRTALDKQRSAKSEFFAKRAALEQFVGNETFVQFEEELLARENGETTSPMVPDESKTEIVQDEINENLVQIPEIRMNEEDNDSEEVMTGSSSNIDIDEDEIDSSAPDEKTKKKEKKSKSKKEKQKVGKQKKDLTKGLIFLHGQDKSSFRNSGYNTQTQALESGYSEYPVSAPAQVQPANQYDFAPLDEIRVPDLTRGGYSIHSELPY